MNGDDDDTTIVRCTDFCPCCENAIMLTDGLTEWCESCHYSRDYEDAYRGEGLA